MTTLRGVGRGWAYGFSLSDVVSSTNTDMTYYVSTTDLGNKGCQNKQKSLELMLQWGRAEKKHVSNQMCQVVITCSAEKSEYRAAERMLCSPEESEVASWRVVRNLKGVLLPGHLLLPSALLSFTILKCNLQTTSGCPVGQFLVRNVASQVSLRTHRLRISG